MTAKYLTSHVVSVAQWIARWTSNPKVPGSNPGSDENFYPLLLNFYPLLFKEGDMWKST